MTTYEKGYRSGLRGRKAPPPPQPQPDEDETPPAPAAAPRLAYVAFLDPAKQKVKV
jgi:hypothetical protein